MNPLNMMGPQFLRFYLLYGVAVILAGLMFRRFAESLPATASRWSPGVYPREGDAYAIALLRGGTREVARTVLARLISLDLITVEDRMVRQSGGQPPPMLAPVESAALGVLRGGMSGDTGLSAFEAERDVLSAVKPHLKPLESELRLQGLLPDSSFQERFEHLRLLLLFVLPGLGLLKLLMAMLRGRSNVGFLIVMTIIYAAVVFMIFAPPRRTRAGERYLAWLSESHQGLAKLLSQGRRERGAELALVAGIYGLQAVPELGPLRKALQPTPPPTALTSTSGSYGGGCGGGVGDSGGSCGGGSCGGGGCGGGGCGGCGG
jgi:uncharacterized protein (TIGR04222 family)